MRSNHVGDLDVHHCCGCYSYQPKQNTTIDRFGIRLDNRRRDRTVVVALSKVVSRRKWKTQYRSRLSDGPRPHAGRTRSFLNSRFRFCFRFRRRHWRFETKKQQKPRWLLWERREEELPALLRKPKPARVLWTTQTGRQSHASWNASASVVPPLPSPRFLRVFRPLWNG